MNSPLDQFQITKIIELELFGIDISITNSTLSLFVVVAIICFFFTEAIRKANRHSKMRTISAILYNMISDMLENSVGEKGKSFFTFCIIFIYIYYFM